MGVLIMRALIFGVFLVPSFVLGGGLRFAKSGQEHEPDSSSGRP